MPVGRLFCVVRGPTRGRPCASAGIRAQLHHAAAVAGSGFGSRRISCAMRMPSRCPREAISLLVIQRQLGHADLASTSRYLRGIDNTEIIAAVHERPAPMIPADPRLIPRRLRTTATQPEARRLSACSGRLHRAHLGGQRIDQRGR
jgi:hypothetical protein